MRAPAISSRLQRVLLLVCVLGVAACSSGSSGEDAGTSHATAGNGEGGASAGTGGAGAAGTGGAGTAGSAGASGVLDAGVFEDASRPVPGASCVVGDYEFASGTSDIVAADGCNRCSCNDGVLGCTRIACPAPDPAACLVAVRLDTCCERHEPATRAMVDAEECLVPYPAIGISSALRQRCVQQSPVDCRLVDCAPDVLSSRVAQPDGQGACRYADECQSASDCVLAIAKNACCACYESTPRVLAEQHRCLAIEGESGDFGQSCSTCDLDVVCGPCPEPTEPTCVVQDSWSECR